MRAPRPPAHSWLSLRIRLLCTGVFIVSLFLPPYITDVSSSPLPDLEGDGREFLLAEEGFLQKTSALTEQGTRSAYSEGIIHTVEANESISSIAKSSFLQPETIRWANGLSEKAQVKAGQKLLILPVDGVLHKVKRGQNLQMIADLFGVPASSIAMQNKIRGGYLLAGQELIIPGGKPVLEATPKPPKAVATKTPAIPNIKVKFPQIKEYAIEPTYGILQMPCDCFLTQAYNASHFGIDLQHRGGSPNFASEAGTVIRAEYGWNGGYGNIVVIDHGNGLQTLYAHNKELYVAKGDAVTRGQPITCTSRST
jgi:LysM repeat protein